MELGTREARLRLGRGMHPFAGGSLTVLDEAGRPLPLATSLVDSGGSLRIEVYGRGVPHRVVWGGRFWSVSRAPALP